MTNRYSTQRHWRRQGGEMMRDLFALSLYIMCFLATSLIIFAYKKDYDVHGSITWTNWAVTTALITITAFVFLEIMYLMSPILEGR
jgi:hypothetical protein